MGNNPTSGTNQTPSTTGSVGAQSGTPGSGC
jgi:hypothetical protein